MRTHSVFNPIADAVKNRAAMDEIAKKAGSRNWATFGFCWDCRTDKPKTGGKYLSKPRAGQIARFRCAACVEEKAAKKVSDE